MKLLTLKVRNSERGESQIGLIVGALVIGILCFAGFSFMDWWQGMKNARGEETYKYFFTNREKNNHIKIKIEKGHRMTFTRDQRN